MWSNNIVQVEGYEYRRLDVSWSGETLWPSLTADEGAVLVSDSSNVSWSGGTTWFKNTAGVGEGAVSVFDSSRGSWTGNSKCGLITTPVCLEGRLKYKAAPTCP